VIGVSFGVVVQTRTGPPSEGGTVNSGTAFVVGPASVLPAGPPPILRSLDDFAALYCEADTPYTGASIPSYDWFDTFYREGGGNAVFGAYDPVAGTYANGLAIIEDLGQNYPGQLAIIDPLGPTEPMFEAMAADAVNYNRFAVRDVAQTDNTAALMETTGLLAPLNDEYGATFGPWVTVPGVTGIVGGGPRLVPYSAVICALCNRVEQNGNPNRAAAGGDYPLIYVTDFVDVNDVDRAGLFLKGVNCPHNVFGINQNYGFQTNVALSPDTPFWQANCSRARMWLKASALRRGQTYMFKTIDGKGRLLAALKGDLEAECKTLYDADGLYGDIPADAYQVSVSAVLNTDASIAQGEIRAVMQARLSVHARSVFIELVSVPITGSVSGPASF
jgi:hypothetical protein